METLKEKLKDFESKINENTNENELQDSFEKLAPAFLYGGYIQVRNDYRVYIKTVEFYFHSETENGIKDPIVYHRNNRYVEGEIPYFPLMSIHAHSSGFDITFESKEKQYRASALIRAYEVKSSDEKYYFIWNKNKEMFEKKEKYGFNTQSTYLEALLNGFIIDKDNNKDKVIWVPNEEQLKNVNKEENIRQNVPLYRPEGRDYLKITKDFYFKNKDYVEKIHSKLKKSEPVFFKSGKEICLRDPKLWQFNRNSEI